MSDEFESFIKSHKEYHFRWRTVPICDDHWHEEEGSRDPVLYLGESEPCYRCGSPSVIYVRRLIEESD